MIPVCWMVSMAVVGLLACACGPLEDNDVDLTPYAGRFDVVETFFDDTGNLCPDPPTEPRYNIVTIDIDKNKFSAEFYERWRSLVGGTIFEDKRFEATRSELDNRVEFVGAYDDEDNFSAIMRDIQQDCTRTFDLVGARVLP